MGTYGQSVGLSFDPKHAPTTSRFLASSHSMTPACTSKLLPGRFISECALWVEWVNQGRLVSDCNCSLFALSPDDVAEILRDHLNVYRVTVAYAERYVHTVESQHSRLSDIVDFEIRFKSSDDGTGSRGGKSSFTDSGSFGMAVIRSLRLRSSLS